MSARARWFGFVFGGVALALTGGAYAQDSAVAQALFERGVADLEAGKLESACPTLAESHRLDPRAGTLFALAECEAKAGNSRAHSRTIKTTWAWCRASRSSSRSGTPNASPSLASSRRR